MFTDTTTRKLYDSPGCESNVGLNILTNRFSMVLDARKSGLRVKPEVFKEDRARYMGKLQWRSHKKGEVDDGEPFRIRPKNLGRFIVGTLSYSEADVRWTS